MKYPERNKHCPERATCFAYHDRACDSCSFGIKLHKLCRKIARLEQKLKKHEERKGLSADDGAI